MNIPHIVHMIGLGVSGGALLMSANYGWNFPLGARSGLVIAGVALIISALFF